jgi:hypothetical protein
MVHFEKTFSGFDVNMVFCGGWLIAVLPPSKMVSGCSFVDCRVSFGKVEDFIDGLGTTRVNLVDDPQEFQDVRCRGFNHKPASSKVALVKPKIATSVDNYAIAKFTRLVVIAVKNVGAVFKCCFVKNHDAS